MWQGSRCVGAPLVVGIGRSDAVPLGGTMAWHLLRLHACSTSSTRRHPTPSYPCARRGPAPRCWRMVPLPWFSPAAPCARRGRRRSGPRPAAARRSLWRRGRAAEPRPWSGPRCRSRCRASKAAGLASPRSKRTSAGPQAAPGALRHHRSKPSSRRQPEGCVPDHRAGALPTPAGRWTVLVPVSLDTEAEVLMATPLPAREARYRAPATLSRSGNITRNINYLYK